MHTQFDANTTAAAAHVIKANRPLMIWANKKYDSHYFTAKVCEKLENVRLLHVLSPDMQTDTADIFEVCLNEVRTNLSRTYNKVVILIEGASSNMLRLALERVYKDHVLARKCFSGPCCQPGSGKE